MAWKVITILAIFALCEARPPTSEQRVKIENWLPQQSEHREDYASKEPAGSYEFSYEVSDPHTHDFKGQHEEKKGDHIKGYYWLVQPDGLKRTVKYQADKHSGFNADVHYTKHWEGENNNQEGETNEEENNAAENENTEESENNAGNENEGEGETENNEAAVGEAVNNVEQEVVEESENQEGEQSELREEHWKRGRNENRRRSESGQSELKATVGIWQPWGKRNQLRHERSDERNENKGENAKRGRGRRGRKEEVRQDTQNNENNAQNEQNENNENAEGRNENDQKNKILSKTEYHIIIHHPKH